VFKKLLIAVGLSGLIYWFAKKRGKDDEFTFTEVPPDQPDD
jgi:hypothetical protein